MGVAACVGVRLMEGVIDGEIDTDGASDTGDDSNDKTGIGCCRSTLRVHIPPRVILEKCESRLKEMIDSQTVC